MSTLKELARRWAPGVLGGFVKQGEHKALADIQESIRELAYYRQHLFAAGRMRGRDRADPGFADVVAAAARIGPHVVRTPVMRSDAFDARVGRRVFFKCENLQTGGAFKFRGATNVLLQLDPARTPLVITHSSGNHGNALALAARARGMRAIVVVPRDSARTKIAGDRGGRRAPRVVRSRIAGARTASSPKFSRSEPAELVHPFDDDRIIAGQGTAALEMLAEVPALDVISTPVGRRRTHRRHRARRQKSRCRASASSARNPRRRTTRSSHSAAASGAR